MTHTKKENFAREMSEELFQIRSEDYPDSSKLPEDFIDATLNDPVHAQAIKEKIKKDILNYMEQYPEEYLTNDNKGYEYKYDTYDHSYVLDTYLENEYEKQRQARLIKKYKIWIEIERIEYDPEDDIEDYIDEEIPFGIAEVNSFDDALKLREEINKVFGQINPSNK